MSASCAAADRAGRASASPSRLVPNTTKLIATPGKITSHGAVRTYSAANSDSMRPQDGCGSGTPRPRNDSEASIRIVEPSCAVASTISGASVFGKTWRIAMRFSRHADRLGGLDEGLLAQAQRIGPDHARDIGHQRDRDRDDRVVQRRARAPRP